MAYEMNLFSITRKSSGDMSSKQYVPVALSTTNSQDGVVHQVTAGGKVIGVWQDNSTAANHGKIMVAGVSKLQAACTGSAAISPQTVLVAGTGGHAIPRSAADQFVIGYSLDSMSTGSSGVISAVLTIGPFTT